MSWDHCPQPYPDCRPGACSCDMVYDRAKSRGYNPERVRQAFYEYAKGLTITKCNVCDGDGYTVTETTKWDEKRAWAESRRKHDDLRMG